MVPLTHVPSEFEGRVLVAKLGSAGILAELRGISQVYPAVLDEPAVWVEATEFNDARELIVADTDDAFAAAPDDDGAPPLRRPGVLLALVALVVLVSFAYGMRSCASQAPPAPGRTSVR